MKVVVLGGGIAGLCMGIYLHQHGIDVSVNEKQIFTAVGGHAFLMHHDGITVLNELAADSNHHLPGKPVDTFVLRDPNGHIIAEKVSKTASLSVQITAVYISFYLNPANNDCNFLILYMRRIRS